MNAQGVNDGRLASQTAGGVTTSYSYDFMGRLEWATRAGQWLHHYEFDGFGNLTKRTVTLPGQPPVVEASYPVNAATNRRTGSGTYDAAGNHVWHPSVVYDTDNRMVAAPGPSAGTVETYSYAPDNRRVVKKVPGASGFTEITLWVGSVRAAKRVIPNGAGGTTDMDVIVFAGRRFYAAGVQATPAVAEGSDRLGSSSEHKPFGENAPGVFATYSRDGNSTGLDYADQRYYQPGAGRFMTADPYLASGGAADPGSWNRYAYVEGDPVNRTDPRGLYSILAGGCEQASAMAQSVGGSFSCSSSGGGFWGHSPGFSSNSHLMMGGDPTGTPAPGSSVMGTPTALHDAEARHTAGTVVPGFLTSALSTNPTLVYGPLPEDAVSATITFGQEQRNMAILSALTALPQMFWSGFANVLLNDSPRGLGQIIGSLALAIPGPILGAMGIEGGIVFGHGARHLVGSGLTQGAVESVIASEVSRISGIGGSFWGRVTVAGRLIEYRAFPMPNGAVNVGTYYIVP